MDLGKMKETFVFDFYNLYIPKEEDYNNIEEGIRIHALKLAEDFEEKRKNISSRFCNRDWLTAKCYITASNEEEAKKIAKWLEYIYSFAQNRNVFFLHWYKYKQGKKYSKFESKLIEPRENRFTALITGTRTEGAFYKKDISLFINTALKILKDLSESERKQIIAAMHAYNISKSELVIELKFLSAWIALEKLSNSYYNKYKSKNKLFKKEEVNKLKEELTKTLELVLKNDKRLNILKPSVSRNFLYEHNTLQKITLYLDTLNLLFEKEKLYELLKKFIPIRSNLVHNLDSPNLRQRPQNLLYLQKIIEKIILRLLGIDGSLEKRFLIHQYRGKEL